MVQGGAAASLIAENRKRASVVRQRLYTSPRVPFCPRRCCASLEPGAEPRAERGRAARAQQAATCEGPGSRRSSAPSGASDTSTLACSCWVLLARDRDRSNEEASAASRGEKRHALPVDDGSTEDTASHPVRNLAPEAKVTRSPHVRDVVHELVAGHGFTGCFSSTATAKALASPRSSSLPFRS